MHDDSPNSIHASLKEGLARVTMLISEHVEESVPPAAIVTLGRGASSDIVCNEPHVSRRHLELRDGETLDVRDVGSANGTEVIRAGERISLDQGAWTPLQSGDRVVTLGDTTLVSVPFDPSR